MKAKRLLGLGMMLACGLGLQAQTSIFHEGFDAEQTKQPTDVAWYEFINQKDGDSFSIISSDAYAGGGCLNFFNDLVEGNWWERAVKFRNLPLQEGKSYRLTWRFKGSNTWNIDGTTENKSKMSVALMQGGEDADISLLDAQGNEFRYEVSYFNPDNYEKYTKMFYFASAQLQKDTYAEKYPDREPLADTFFATFNVFNPGDYYLDEVDLHESPIAGVYFSGDVIKVDFGYATNIASLAQASPIGIVQMPKDCAAVKLNGADAEIDCIELHKDGYLYVFLTEFIETEDAQVEVAFKNPEDASYQVQYSGTLAPEGAAFDFAGEVGEFQSGLEEVYSWAYTEPTMVSVTPIDGSFGLDETLSEVTFTFDKPVLTTNVDGMPLSCVVNGNENMELVTEAGDEGSTTLTFRRAGGQTFTKGAYTVVLSGIVSDKYTEAPGTFSVNFETGKIQIAEEIITPVGRYDFSEDAANTIPVGWTVNNEGEIRPGGSSQGSGPRLFTFADGGDVKNALYLRCKLDAAGVSTGGYALKDEAVTLPAGDLRIQFLGFCWKGSALKVRGEILDESGENVVASQEGTFDYNVDGNTGKPATCDKVTVAFNNPAEGNYRLRLTLLPTGTNWMEVVFGGVVVNTYTKTDGESTEAEVILDDKTYGGVNAVDAEDNHAPKAGSGWALYQESAKRTPGADFNYNGTRIFKLGAQNLGCAYYTNGSWPDNYVIYGEGSDDDTEPTLHLTSGRYQFTYYAANWKENGANAGKDHIVYFELASKESGTVIYDRNDKIVGCDLNGSRDASIPAQMVQFIVNIAAEGDYTMKLGGTMEQMIGNYKVEKLGSQTAYYIGQIIQYRTLAEDEYKASEDAMYDGTAKTALKAVIEKYADPTFLHTPAEVAAAVAELQDATKAMSTRREYVSRYETAKQAAADLLAEVGETEEHAATKYAQLEAFSALENTFQQYYDVTAQDLENDELVASTTALENNTTWLKNMKDKCVALLTKQIVDAAAALVALDPSMESDEQVLAAGNALTDDQDIASLLKLRLTKAIYEQCANGDPFSVLDESIMEVITDSINVSSYIQNANLYTTETSATRNLTDPANLPGWTIDQISGTPMLGWSWEAWSASELSPITDAILVCGWSTEWDLYQTVTSLPVGKYRYVSGTQDRGFNDNSDAKKAALADRKHYTVTGNDGEGEIFSYIWWQVGEQRDSVGYDITNQGQWYAYTNCHSRKFDIPAMGDTQMGEVTIGSHAIEFQSLGSADNFQLYMVGKDPSFDYAAAAKKIGEDITGVESTVQVPEGEPVSVRYYDLTGKMVAQPSGITVKVATYKNGAISVSKFIAK